MDPVDPEGGGNTIPPPKKAKRTSLARYWCGTLFPQSLADRTTWWNHLIESNYIMFVAMQDELTEDGKPHIQFVVQLRKKERLLESKKIPGNPHLEVCRGNVEQNVEYCTRPSKRMPLGHMYNSFPDRVWEPSDHLAKFQQIALHIASKPVVDRQVYNFYGTGGLGKTYCQRLLFYKHGTMPLGGQLRHTSAGLHEFGGTTNSFSFNIPFGGTVPYKSIELASDCFGWAHFGTKRTGLINFKPATVFVFSNHKIDDTRLARNRVKFFNIDDIEADGIIDLTISVTNPNPSEPAVPLSSQAIALLPTLFEASGDTTLDALPALVGPLALGITATLAVGTARNPFDCLNDFTDAEFQAFMDE